MALRTFLKATLRYSEWLATNPGLEMVAERKIPALASIQPQSTATDISVIPFNTISLSISKSHT
jgi:hypothetical protein